MCAILVAANPLGQPLGHPVYHPIFEAGAEHGLPISVHINATLMSIAGGIIGGSLGNIIDVSTTLPLWAHHHISSMIVHGVFEKYPSTRVLFKEYGSAWLPWLMWRLDEQYDRFREESPWVKKWPSEYIRQHIKLGTQPVEEGARVRDVADLLGMVDGVEDLLCYASDYPHGTMDGVSHVASTYPKEWHEKIFYGNACDTYGWESPKALSAVS
jgi:predicted TIM-barrel fold metal-dependent hydrolase